MIVCVCVCVCDCMCVSGYQVRCICVVVHDGMFCVEWFCCCWGREGEIDRYMD